MAKWKNRTSEEKTRILKDQRRIREEADRSKVRGTPMVLKDAEAVGIYERKEIPLPCLDCGWQGSDRYRVYKGEVLGARVEFVEGTCRGCKKVVRRVFPNPLGSEGVMFVLVAGMLKKGGRLRDERCP